MKNSTGIAAGKFLLLLGGRCASRRMPAASARTPTSTHRARRAAGSRRDGDPPRGIPEQGADQRHRPDPGVDGPAGHQGLPGRRALHARRDHRQLRHQRHLDPRHLLLGRRRHHRHLHRRHADPDALGRLQSGRHAAEDLRPGARRGAARTAGHAVRRRRRGRRGALHPHASRASRPRTPTCAARCPTPSTASPSGEFGIAHGQPIVDGTFGVRASIWYRYDGGWIDRVDPDTAGPPSTTTSTTPTPSWGGWRRSGSQPATSPSRRASSTSARTSTTNRPTGRRIPIRAQGQFNTATPERVGGPDKYYLPALKIAVGLG